MILFLLKSSACMALFLTFYTLLLEKESIHSFKRFYLIGALAASFAIPNIVFTEHIEITPTQEKREIPPTYFTFEEAPVTEFPKIEPKIDWEPVLWYFWGIGVLAFGFRFVRHLSQMALRIHRNPKLKKGFVINVLLQEQLPPHTFFNYVFLNRQKYEANGIPREILLHEETHARQKHSADVLLIEFVQVILWFNPLVQALKKAIKLNHEFLADRAVVKSGVPTGAYQSLLLSYSSNALSPQLANLINYASIKKRMSVMKTQTSRKGVLARSILLLPLFSLALYAFSETQTITVQKKPIDVQETTSQDPNHFSNAFELKNPTAKDFKKWQNKSDYAIWVHGKSVDNSELKKYDPSDFAHYSLSFVHKNARSERFPQAYQLRLYTQKEFEEAFVKDNKQITVLINKKGQLLFNNQLVTLEELPSLLIKFNNDFPKEERGRMIKANIITDNSAPINVIDSVKKVLNEYGVSAIHLTHQNPIPPPSQQGNTTPKQLSEYNDLAEKYNAMIKKGDIRIKKSEIDYLKHIHDLMTEDQKAKAEPFPDFPEPPTAPNVPHSPPNQNEKERAATEIQEIVENQAIYDEISMDKKTIDKIALNQKSMEHEESDTHFFSKEKETIIYLNGREISYFQMKKMEKEGKITSMNVITAQNGEKTLKIIDLNSINHLLPLRVPPAPKSPVEYLVEMAQKGALFYYEDKEISSDKAVEILKKNNNLNISTKRSSSERPIVKLSTKSFGTEN